MHGKYVLAAIWLLGGVSMKANAHQPHVCPDGFPDEPAFIRTSGPDANACAGCHNQHRAVGARGVRPIF